MVIYCLSAVELQLNGRRTAVESQSNNVVTTALPALSASDLVEKALMGR